MAFAEVFKGGGTALTPFMLGGKYVTFTISEDLLMHAAPEPITMLGVGLSLVSIGTYLRRRRKQQAWPHPPITAYRLPTTDYRFFLFFGFCAFCPVRYCRRRETWPSLAFMLLDVMLNL